MTAADGPRLPMRTPLQQLQQDYPHLNVRIDPSRGQACYVADGPDEAGKSAEYAADSPDALRHRIEGALLELDTTRPSAARIYDYLLGGKDNFAADREEADKILALFPQARDMAQDARRFLARAVRHVANTGVRQFIDLGAGLPTSPNVHEIAREVHKDARVVYVDHDPMVLIHAKAMIPSGDPGLAAVAGDLAYPAEVMASEKLNAVIDLLEPVCVILSMALHFQRPKAARRIMAGFVEAIKPGSYVIASIVCGNAALAEQVTQLYTAETVYNHTPDVFESWLAGMEIVWPGLCDAREWQPRGPVIPASPRDATVLAGVAVKPGRFPAVSL